MQKPRIAITILAHHSKNTVRECVSSALNLDYEGEIDVYIREQGGDDNEYALLKKLAQTTGPLREIFLSRGENIGFAAGHNVLIRETNADFVLCLNADAILQPQFLKEALPAFDDPNVGAVQGKSLRWDEENNDVRRGPTGKPVVDTCGLLPLRNRRIINRGQGEEDRGQYDQQTEVWGPDGATPFYRRAALDDIAVPVRTKLRFNHAVRGLSPHSEYFDESFFAYKEDVDLAWRLQLRGWKTLYVPTAVAWHARGSGDSAARSPIQILVERRKLSRTSRYYAFVNQRLMQIKNETWRGLLRDFPWWFPKEIASWIWVLLTEPYTIPAIGRMCKLLPLTLRKRRWIQTHKKPDADPYRFFQ